LYALCVFILFASKEKRGCPLKIRISITVSEKILGEFKRFCEQNGMKVSSKIERMMIDTIRQNKINTTINTTMDNARTIKEEKAIPQPIKGLRKRSKQKK